MATRRKPNKTRDRNQITAAGKPDKDQAVAIARTVLRPSAQAAVTIKEFGKAYGDLLDLSSLIDALTEQARASSDGDLQRAEAMLTAQAHTLDSVFNTLARRAINAKLMDHLEKYLKLALRAQSQCRATWEALAAIKNPPIVFAKQANISQGHQQVNNGNVATSRTRESKNKQTQLSGADNELLPDTRASGNEGEVNPTLETLGKIDRAKVRRG